MIIVYSTNRLLFQVTGEAFSFGRRALVAAVSHDGGVIEPVSLSSTIDISPAPVTEDATALERDGPGPLASAVLIEQVKLAGATKEVWPSGVGVSNASVSQESEADLHRLVVLDFVVGQVVGSSRRRTQSLTAAKQMY